MSFFPPPLSLQIFALHCIALHSIPFLFGSWIQVPLGFRKTLYTWLPCFSFGDILFWCLTKLIAKLPHSSRNAIICIYQNKYILDCEVSKIYALLAACFFFLSSFTRVKKWKINCTYWTRSRIRYFPFVQSPVVFRSFFMSIWSIESCSDTCHVVNTYSIPSKYIAMK